MVMESFVDHLMGNLVIVTVFGVGTIACFAVAIRMLVKPGEKDKNHPKYLILRDDR